MGAGRAREVAAFSAFSRLAFLVDTASELLPKRFAGQGLGQAKRTSTMNGPEMSSLQEPPSRRLRVPGEIREGQNNERKLNS